MNVGAFLTGIHARSETLIQATQDYARRSISESDLGQTFRRDVERLINLQMENEFTFLTDGMLSWNDLLRPFTVNLKGVEPGPLTRWFDTNTFYRAPKILDKLEHGNSILEGIQEKTILRKEKPFKATVPGPYTFAQLANPVNVYKDRTNLMYDFAKVLNCGFKNLSEKGFKNIQLSEPSLTCRLRSEPLTHDEKINVGESIRIAVDGTDMNICLHTFFGSFENLLPEVLDYPVDCLGIDFLDTPHEVLKGYHLEKSIAAGLVDARSALVETPQELIRYIKEIQGISTQLYLCPNSALEYRPERIAEAKIRSIGSALRMLKEIGDA